MIKIIKLITGIEVVGDMVGQNNTLVKIEDPIQINYKNVESPMPCVSLTRYLQFSKEKACVFEKSNIINIVDPLDNFVSYYNVALKHFESEIDSIVDQELLKVCSDDSEDRERLLAMLEKATLNRVLN